MSGTVEDWVAKAEGDFRTARREFEAPELPNYDAVCFHAQQCAEKLLKAILISRGVTHPHIHDLVQLAKLVQPHLLDWQPTEKDLRLISQGGVTLRNPDGSASKEDAAEALKICDGIRNHLLGRLPGYGSDGDNVRNQVRFSDSTEARANHGLLASAAALLTALSALIAIHVSWSLAAPDRRGMDFFPSTHGWATLEFFFVLLPLAVVNLVVVLAGMATPRKHVGFTVMLVLVLLSIAVPSALALEIGL